MKDQRRIKPKSYRGTFLGTSQQALKTTLLALSLTTLSACGFVQKEINKSLGIKDKKNASNSNQPLPSQSQIDPQLNLLTALKTFKDCSESENWLEAKIIATIEKKTNQQIQMIRCSNPDYAKSNPNECQILGGSIIWGGVSTAQSNPEIVMPASTNRDTVSTSSAPESAPQNSTKSGPATTTGTNNQVSGVEEADLVKTEGSTIYYLAGQKLHVMQGWPATEAKMLGSIGIKGTPLEMFIGEQNLVYVISSSGFSTRIPIFQLPIASVGQIGSPGSAPSVDMATTSQQPLATAVAQESSLLKPQETGEVAENAEPRVHVTIVQATNPLALQILSTRSFRGTYLSSRKIGNDIRVVVNDSLGSILLPSIQLPSDPKNTQEQEELVREIMELAKKRIVAKDLAHWLGTQDPQGIGPQLGSCDKVYGPTYDMDLGLTRIISLLGPQTISESVLLANVNGIYSSQKSLYLATARQAFPESLSSTVVHKFRWESAGNSIYQGSGHVEGTPLNQFSMDEHNDAFRIAVTGQEPQSFTTFNKVFVLTQNQGYLETRGSTSNMAKGERIYSVRFYGERGFVVTFKKVDPLFTLDLKDPTAPKVVGELKIPGYSSYIHMMNDTTLLTVGRGGNGTAVNLPKISVFDVSDMAAPKEVKSLVINTAGWATTEAESNHKAFTYYDQLGVLALPVNNQSVASQSSFSLSSASIMVFDVKNTPAIVARGTIDLTPSTGLKTNLLAQRSLFMEDYLYGFSNLGMKIRKMTDLTKDVSAVVFPQ